MICEFEDWLKNKEKRTRSIKTNGQRKLFYGFW